MLKNIYSIISLRALNFIALFVFIINYNLNGQFLNNINSDFIKIDSNILNDSTKVDSVISFIQKNNIDNIFIHIYSNGEAFHNSNLIFSDLDIIDVKDNLMSFMNKVDSIDVKTYAWLNVYNLWKKNFYPGNNNHFYYQCPECLESDINGRSDKYINLNQIQSLEWEGIYLSPMHPLVNNYILSIINEVVSKYEFDGLFLDYLRYQDYYYGYNLEGIEEFENIHEINPLDFNRGIISRRYGYNKNQIDSLKYIWNNFKSNKITELLFAINNNFQNTNLEIGVNAISDPLESKNRYYQDWKFWIESNLIDFAVIQNSENNFIEFNYLIKKINKQIDSFNRKKIFFEMSSSNDKTFDISNKIISLRLNGYENIGIDYSFNKDTTNWYKQIYENINFRIDK